MTLLAYQIFQTVVEQGSFQRAAEIMNLTPSAQSATQFPLQKRNSVFLCLTATRTV